MFGIEVDVKVVGYEWIGYLLVFMCIVLLDFCVMVGEGCVKLYLMFVFNILVMSFGVLLGNVICVFNCGVRFGNFIYDIGEGLILLYYCEEGGDLIWEVVLGYFGCCDVNGWFDLDCFVE